MPRIVEPILIFAGQANQAISLYEKAFGAKLKEKILFSEANLEDWQCKEEEKDLVYHAQIKIGKQVLMIADDCEAAANGNVETSAKPFFIELVVQFDSDNELKAAYDVLSNGGTITAPLCSQTYCSLTCALVDKFGGRWQLMSGYNG